MNLVTIRSVASAAVLDPEEVAALLALEGATQQRPTDLDSLLRDVAGGGVLLVADAHVEQPPTRARTGTLVGFLAARAAVDELDVTRLAVEEVARRRGIGRRLVEAMLAHACTVGARSVTLEVRADAGPARALYGSLGFVQDGLRPGYYPDGVDAVLMRRTFAPAP